MVIDFNKIASSLDGPWKPAGDNSDGRPLAMIRVSSRSISVDMSEYGRPRAYGSTVDEFTITVTFPDDRTYTGKMEKILVELVGLTVRLGGKCS